MEITTQTADPLMLSAVMHVAKSDIGKRREENQDSFLTIEAANFKFYLVADGMGGVKGGALASQLAMAVLGACLKSKIDINAEDIVSAVAKANIAIFERGIEKSEFAGMGTTLVGLCFLGANYYVVNVGDSRAYRIRRGGITQLTEDHTLVRELLRSGAIDESQVENHPVSHMLTRSLGPTPMVEVDCRMEEDVAQGGDVYLLCTDGLYNMLSEADILKIVAGNQPQDAADKLIALANERGGTDNITVILISISAGTAGELEDRGAAVSEEGGSVTTTLELNETLELHQPVLADDSPEDASPQNGSPQGAAAKTESSASPEIRANIDTEGLASEMLSQGAAAEQAAIGETNGPDSKPNLGNEGSDTPKPALIHGWGMALLVVTFSALGFIIGGYFSGERGVFQVEPLPPVAVDMTARAPSFPTESNLDSAGEVAKQAPEEMVPQLDELESESGDAVDREEHAPDADMPAGAETPPSANDLLSEQADAPHSEMKSQDASLPDLVMEPHNADMLDSYIDGLDAEEVANIEKRKAFLKEMIKNLDTQISSFDKPLAGDSTQILRDNEIELERLQNALSEVKVELDVAGRRLAVWYGRRERLKTTESLKLATEVSAVSQVVREKQEAFQRVTWLYLKEVEALRYSPDDAEQKRRVSDLMAQRKGRMHELAVEVQRAIDEEVARSDHILAELTLKRGNLEGQIADRRRDLEYFQALFSADGALKNRKKQELTTRREVAVAELEELRQLKAD